MKRGADWLSWSLQFIAGSVVGAVGGLYILSRASRYHLTSEDVVTLILGGALIGAGLASFYGDRLWIGLSYRVIPPDDIEQSETSQILSMATGALGVCVLLRDFLHHFQIFSR
jgi:hypothetical protein